jgi:hypothetical protein
LFSVASALSKRIDAAGNQLGLVFRQAQSRSSFSPCMRQPDCFGYGPCSSSGGILLCGALFDAAPFGVLQLATCIVLTRRRCENRQSQ